MAEKGGGRLNSMSLRLGILSDSRAQAYSLQIVASECGMAVVYSGPLSFREMHLGQPPEVDAWVIIGSGDALAAADQHPLLIHHRHQVIALDQPVPTLVSANYNIWKAEMLLRLQSVSARQRQISTLAAAKKLWVLAASTGGVDAVGRFLERVEPIEGVGLLYVQHIAEAHVEQLLRMVTRRSHWKAEIGMDGTVIRERSVTVISPAAKVHLEAGGKLRRLEYPWGGHYCPSIDHVAGLVAREYGTCAGMIVFTGMGYDGVVGSRLIRHRGGKVWVQSPAECAATSMPETVLAAQAVDFVGTVEELAANFVEKMGENGRALVV